MTSDWTTHSDAGWEVALPSGVGGGPVKNLTNPELTTVAIFRGWVGEDALCVGVSSRPREHSSLKDESRKLSQSFSDGPTEGELVDVPGSYRGARRADGLMGVEEGYGDPPDWTERVTYVVAGLGKQEVAVLTIRHNPVARLDEVVDRIVASFRLGVD